jgi:hypothetical protein
MSSYVLIESRDPFEGRGFGLRCDLAAALVAHGATVTLFLLENGVLAGRGTAQTHELEKLARCGATLLADEFALRERGIGAGELAGHVKPAALDALIEQLVAGAVVLWN